jgi:tight adherence protein B
LAKVIRSRFRLFRWVRAITAEAKWSGTFLSGFPLAALVMINLLDPNYYDDVRETSYFIPACLVVAAFLVTNIFVMKMLVNIKV